MRVLITGANGFVGAHIVQSLSDSGMETVGLVRRPVDRGVPGTFVVDADMDHLSEHVANVDAVIHTAGVAHRASTDEEAIRKSMMEGNAELTSRIAKAVRDSGAKTLIHISSIAAAEFDSADRGARAAYGESKLLAEKSVEELREHGKLGVNLRPPLIYGAGAKGNWPKLVKLAKLPVPLPFGSVKNRRSFLGISNLCGLVESILAKSGDAESGGTYAVADDELVSLREIVNSLRDGLGRGRGLFPFPVRPMDGLLRFAGRATMADGLFQDLRIDSDDAKRRFDWSPEEATLPGMVKSLSSRGPAWI